MLYQGITPEQTVQGNIENIVVFICFADEDPVINDDEIKDFERLYNGSTQSVDHFLKTVSEYNSVSGKGISLHSTLITLKGPDPTKVYRYQDSHPRGYYEPYDADTNTIGYTDATKSLESSDFHSRENNLITNAIAAIDGSPLLAGKKLDTLEKDYVDCITFITPPLKNMPSHKALLPKGKATLNGKAVREYVLALNHSAKYLRLSTFIHETLHIFGLPDLYDEEILFNLYDVMSDSPTLAIPNSYSKLKYAGWGTPPEEITTNGYYTLSPVGSTNGTTAYAIATSDPEQFILLEYRKLLTPSDYNLMAGDGLTILRINQKYRGNRPALNGIEVYNYRPDETGVNQCGGSWIKNSFLSLDNGRSYFGTSTPDSGYKGMIYLEDGTNTKIVINNISSAGETISFDVIKNHGNLNPRKLTCNHKANGGTASDTTIMAVPWTTVELPLASSHSNRTKKFLGWHTDKNSMEGFFTYFMNLNEVTLYAIYDLTPIATFIDYDGTTKRTRTIKGVVSPGFASSTIARPDPGEYPGWSNNGWSITTEPDDNFVSFYDWPLTITEDTTFYAHYRRDVTLSYNANGGNSTPPSKTSRQYAKSYNINDHSEVIFYNLAKAIKHPAGWEFDSWAAENPDGTRYAPESSITVKKDTTMFALWKGVVTYNYSENGGVAPNGETVIMLDTPVGTKVKLYPAAFKEGWEFVGWNTDKDTTTALTSLTMSSPELTLYAIYKKTVTATFIDYSSIGTIVTIPGLDTFHDKNKKTQTRTVQATYYNKEKHCIISPPAHNVFVGCEPHGWTTSTTFPPKDFSPSGMYILSEDTTFYGLYKRTITLSYDPNGGSPTPSEQSGTQYVNSYDVSVLSSVTFKLAEAISQIRLLFDAWAQGSTTGTKYPAGSSIAVTEDTTMYALWKKRPILKNNTTVTWALTETNNSKDDSIALEKGWIIYEFVAPYEGIYTFSTTNISSSLTVLDATLSDSSDNILASGQSMWLKSRPPLPAHFKFSSLLKNSQTYFLKLQANSGSGNYTINIKIPTVIKKDTPIKGPRK